MFIYLRFAKQKTCLWFSCGDYTLTACAKTAERMNSNYLRKASHEDSVSPILDGFQQLI